MSYSLPLISHRMLAAVAAHQSQAGALTAWDEVPPSAPGNAPGNGMIVELLENPVAFCRDYLKPLSNAPEPAGG